VIEFFGSKGFHAPGFTIRNAVVVPLLIPPGVPHTATDLLGFLIETPRQATTCLEDRSPSAARDPAARLSTENRSGTRATTARERVVGEATSADIGN